MPIEKKEFLEEGMMERVGKEITSLGYEESFVVSLLSSIALLAMSFISYPAPAAQFYTLATIGLVWRITGERQGL